MSTSKLYLFSKNTDAPFAARGFEYQKMKTLETWIDNCLQKIDEVIYCDYEEDIFQRNDHLKEVKFRQVKLYKDNFSFKSEEVQKAVAHFFMLHVKSNYQDWNKQFVFEASSGVAARRGDNEADLFRQWVASQDNPTPELLAKYTGKVKQLVTDFIEKQTGKLTESEDPATIKEALLVLQQLREEEWQEFTRCIRWEFANSGTPEATFAATHARVQDLLKALPFDPPNGQLQALEGILWKVVSFKIAASQPAERALTLAELEHHILASGSEKDQWYLGVYRKWKPVPLTGELLPGELLEIINAANYCRWTASLSGHDTFWLTWLRSYIEHNQALPILRRNAVHEYLFLRMRPTTYYTPPSGTMEDDKDYARSYFRHFDDFQNPVDFENAQSLLFLLVSAYKLRRTGITKAEITAWLSRFGSVLWGALAIAPTPSSRCRLLECDIINQFFGIRAQNAAGKLAAMQPLVAELLQQLPAATHYNVTRLSEKLYEYQTILLKAQVPEYRPMLDGLEEINQKLGPYVEQRSGAHRRAKKLIEQGAELLQQNAPDSILLALHKFHGAKDLWDNKEAEEGFVLALCQIAHLYQSLGLSLAAKYYALSAAWICDRSEGGKLLAREPEALALVFQADFQQGAWLSATSGFEAYLQTRYQFDPQVIEWHQEPIMQQAVAEYALMLFAASQLPIAIESMLQQQLARFPALIREQFIEPSVSAYHNALTKEELLNRLTSKLTDRPLSDAGAQRIIGFWALGSTWRLAFGNTYRLAPVAEEFAAHLQIMLAEVALSTVDFHLPKSQVQLHLIDSQKWSGPKRIPSNTHYAWEVPLRYFDKPDSEQIKRATAHVSAALLIILGEISLLPAAELETSFSIFFEKSSLATKSLFVNAYQRMYRYFMPHKKFTALQHELFQPVDSLPDPPIKSPAMQWKSSISAKYDRVVSERHIRERFKNNTRCIFLTLQCLQQTHGYEEWLWQLREAGWPDWQIAQAMANYMINDKVQRLLATKKFASEDRHVQVMRVALDQFRQMSELECYRSFSLESFQSEEFREQLQRNAYYMLRSYGLEESGSTPNFNAIQEFLRVRFNGQEQTAEEASPFLAKQQIDIKLISQAIEKDWAQAVSLRLNPSDDLETQPAIAVLTFEQSTQGHAGYELLLDFYRANESVLVLSTVDGRLQVSIADDQLRATLNLGKLKYKAEELDIFLKQQPASSGFVFAIGTEQHQGRGIIATRNPYSSFVLGSYHYE